MSSLRDGILSANKTNIVRVDTPEWSPVGHVFVRTLRCSELSEYRKLFTEKEDGEINDAEILIKFCIMTICDESGAAIFSTDDYEALCNGALPPMHRCYNEAMKLNALSVSAAQELEGN